jgi:ribosomal protein L14E/L6E/L27E
MSTKIVVGSVVLSQQGRDKGNLYLCVGIEDQFAFIADGKTHRLCKPKKKNIKHLKHTGDTLDVIAQKLGENKKVFDSEVNSSLRNFTKAER